MRCRTTPRIHPARSANDRSRRLSAHSTTWSLIPKGRETVVLHRICHRKIHSLFTERKLAKHYPSIAALQTHQDVQAFVRWVAGKDPDFYARTATSRRKSRRG